MTVRAPAGGVVAVSVVGFPTGLASVGLRVVDGLLSVDTVARFTAGVVEAPAGSGIYHASVTAPLVAQKYGLVWDTGGVLSPTNVAEEDLIVGLESAAPSRAIVESAAGFTSGLVGTLGFQIIDPPAGTLIQARSTTAITEYPTGSGIYWKVGTAPSTDGEFAAVWDDTTTWTMDGDALVVASVPSSPPSGVLTDLGACSAAPLDDCSMYRGDTRYLPFQITDAVGAPLDVTGYTIWFTAKRQLSDPDPGVFQQTIAGGELVVTNASLGLGYVRIDPSDTVTLGDSTTQLLWDLQIKSPAADTPVSTVARGTLTVEPDVTRAV